jgi:DNA repair exonuclease SbcCD nuclease subunit
MTTIAHISDTHLGNRQYGSDTRRQDFIDAFEAAVEAAIDADADAIIHTGDLFHRRTPPLPEVNACIRILQRAADAGIPFHAIVGNHDRKMDDQWLDLIEHTGTASRLDQSPTVIGSNGDREDEGNGDAPPIVLYGIDAVPAPAWDSTDFTLDPPPDEYDDAYRLLCMHQLLSPPVPEIMADYPTEAVIDRLDTEIDGLALGDYHESESATVAGVDAWYSGSTERGGAGEAAPRSITLLESTDDGGFGRRHHELDTRPFRTIDIEFGEDDGRAHARETIQNHDLTDAVAVATLTGKRTSLTAGGVHDLLIEHGAAVGRVDDNRGREHLDLDLDDAPSAAVEDADTLIGERLAEADLSEATLAVEEEIRGESTATTSLDGAAENLIMEAQKAAFSEGGPDPDAVIAADDDGDREAGTELEPEPKPEPETKSGTGADGEAEPEPASADGGTASDDAPDAGREASPDAEADVITDEPDVTAEDSPDAGESTASDESTNADEDTSTTTDTGSSNQASFADLMSDSDDDDGGSQ